MAFGAAGFALAAAAVWGAGDFSGAIAARRANVSGVLVIAHGTGMVFLVAIALLRAEPLLDGAQFVYGVGSGLFIGLGLAALYRALTLGSMSLVAPLAAVLSAIIPVVFGIFTEGWPTPLQLAGFVVALVGITFISRTTRAETKHGGLGWAAAAGVSVGIYFILMQQIKTEGLFVPLALVRVTSFALMLLIAFFGYRSWGWMPARAVLPLAMLAGVMDITGSALYVWAGEFGRLDVVAVLSALYPASTVLLARLLLKEQTSRAQNFAILAILAAIVLVTVK